MSAAIIWEPIIITRPCLDPDTAEPFFAEGNVRMDLCFINVPGKWAQYMPRHMIRRKRGEPLVQIYLGDDADGKPMFQQGQPQSTKP